MSLTLLDSSLLNPLPYESYCEPFYPVFNERRIEESRSLQRYMLNMYIKSTKAPVCSLYGSKANYSESSSCGVVFVDIVLPDLA